MDEKKLPRDLVFMDNQGRVTIPKYMREAIGISAKGKVALTAEIYPDMENPKAIIIRRE